MNLDSRQRKTPNSYEGGFSVVPRVGLEPTLPEGNWILNRVSFSLYSPYEAPSPSERVTHIVTFRGGKGGKQILVFGNYLALLK